MFQEVFGKETLAGLKTSILSTNNKNERHLPARYGPDPNSGIELREWVYQCAYERATEIVEKSDVDGSEKGNLNEGFRGQEDIKIDLKSGNLTLAYAELTQLPFHVVDPHCHWVTYLDLSHNNIEEVDFLAYFEHLETLVLDHNKISSATVFPRCRKLRTLWINYCDVSRLDPFCTYLSNSLPKLEYLSMMGNPAAPSFVNGGKFHDYIMYRLFAISQLSKLQYLDDRIVDKDERNEAIRMYGNTRKARSSGRLQSELYRFRGIMLNDLSSSSTDNSSHTALEAADSIEDPSESFEGISDQDSSSTETVYYSFEEHVQYLAQKFSEKFNEWKESFNSVRRTP